MDIGDEEALERAWQAIERAASSDEDLNDQAGQRRCLPHRWEEPKETPLCGGKKCGKIKLFCFQDVWWEMDITWRSSSRFLVFVGRQYVLFNLKQIQDMMRYCNQLVCLNLQKRICKDQVQHIQSHPTFFIPPVAFFYRFESRFRYCDQVDVRHSSEPKRGAVRGIFSRSLPTKHGTFSWNPTASKKPMWMLWRHPWGIESGGKHIEILLSGAMFEDVPSLMGQHLANVIATRGLSGSVAEAIWCDRFDVWNLDKSTRVAISDWHILGFHESNCLKITKFVAQSAASGLRFSCE